jgi:hypothetical protein
MAVSVAAGVSCLRRFRVPEAGRVLLFAAEDALHVVRQRLEGICLAVDIPIVELDVQVITAPSIRLDLEGDRRRLEATVDSLRPKLLILDPFVRLHRVDENVSAEVAPLLAYLRDLQRRYEVAVVVVHHARKGAAHARAGQALRGSSEFHAWGDSNLYLRRLGDDLTLSVEHRAAPSLTPLPVGLAIDQAAVSLEVRAPSATSPGASASRTSSLTDVIEEALASTPEPMPLSALRQRCRARTKAVCDALALLTKERRVIKEAGGYRLAP